MQKSHVTFYRIFTLFCGIGLAHSAAAALIQPDTLWKKKTLNVCFAEKRADLRRTEVTLAGFSKAGAPDGIDAEKLSELQVVPVPDDLKPLIQKAVEDSFSPQDTGISFTGWSDCKAPHDVAVFYVMDDLDRDPNRMRTFAAGSVGASQKFSRTSVRLNHSKVMGFRGDFTAPSIKELAVSVYGKDEAQEKLWEVYGKYDFLRAVVHEFGHIAGLLHEQERFSKADFERYDISYQHLTSADLIEENNRTQELSQFLPKTRTRKIGKANPFSTMHYYESDYDEFAEKTRLMCELVHQQNLNWDQEYTLSNFYAKRIGVERKVIVDTKIDYHAELQRTFCSDPTPFTLTAKSLFDRRELMDLQSKAALKSVYLHQTFVDPLEDETELLDFIPKFWGSMTSFYW